MATINEGDVLKSVNLSHKNVHKYAWGSFAAGFLPAVLPGGVFLDFAGVFGVQMALLKNLADGYGVPFRKDVVKELLGGVLGALAAAKLGYGGVAVSLSALLSPIPIVGSVAKWTMAPGFNYLSTVAVGRIFEKHFAEGGTFLDFDMKSAKARIINEYDEARATLFSAKESVLAKLRNENEDLKAEIERLKVSRAEGTAPKTAPATR
jgi:uncharacterized protein (DUF697 family)